MARPKKSLQQKVQEKMPEFASEVAALSVQDLNNRLAALAKAAEWNETKKEEDEELSAAQAEAAELSAPYRDAKKELRTKSKYVIALIQEKGGA